VSLESLFRREHHAALVALKVLLSRVRDDVSAQIVLVYVLAANVAHDGRWLGLGGDEALATTKLLHRLVLRALDQVRDEVVKFKDVFALGALGPEALVADAEVVKELLGLGEHLLGVHAVAGTAVAERNVSGEMPGGCNCRFSIDEIDSRSKHWTNSNINMVQIHLCIF
jgi:hypothetical protein